LEGEGEVTAMEKFLGPILQGIPTAIGAVIIIILFVNPIDSKVERVMTVMNREIIPVINELKQGRKIESPPVQPVAEQLKELEKGIAELKSEIRKARASIDDVKQFSLVASSLGPALVATSAEKFKTGDIISTPGWSVESKHAMSQKPFQFDLKVTDPRPLNKIRSELVDAWEKAGLKIITQPQKQ